MAAVIVCQEETREMIAEAQRQIKDETDTDIWLCYARRCMILRFDCVMHVDAWFWSECPFSH